MQDAAGVLDPRVSCRRGGGCAGQLERCRGGGGGGERVTGARGDGARRGYATGGAAAGADFVGSGSGAVGDGVGIKCNDRPTLMYIRLATRKSIS